jgi:HD-GYP domain-containing protein (c-di-GMP phosphodiesterase class II)
VPLSQVEDLIRVGEPLPFRVLDVQARMLLACGQKLLNEGQLQMLMDRGAWVERSQVQLTRVQRQQAGHALVPSAYRHRTLFDAWEELVWQLDRVLKRALRREAVAAEIAELSRTLVQLIDRDADVALYTAVRQDDRRFALYALTHGIHTATVTVLAARQLGWPPAQQMALCGAALTMNLSIGELQAQMAEQKTPPTARQLDLIRQHPVKSAELLQACGVADADWLAAVNDHHERRDGSGYPRKATEVGDGAALLRAADVYMAKISPRAQRPALVPKVAAAQLFKEEAGGPIATALIKPLGVYPPGDLVKLRSGEVGVVTRRGASGSAPTVATLTNAQGKPVVNTFTRDTSQPAYAIEGALADRTAYGRVLPERVYGLIDP